MPGQPSSAPRPAWLNSPESWSLSTCPWHTLGMSHGIRLFTPGPAAAAQCCWSILLSLGVVKHLRSKCPRILSPAKAACHGPASFAVYSKRNWIHMDQIPPCSSHTGPGFGSKGPSAVERLLYLPWGPEHSHQCQGEDKPPAKGASSAFKPNRPPPPA